MSKSKRKERRRRKRMGSKSGLRSSSRPTKLADRLGEADELFRQSQWDRAAEMLEELDERYAGRPEVLSRLVEAYYHLDDLPACQFACERLLPLVPDDPDLPVMLGGLYLANARPALAWHTFRQFLRRWAEDPHADEICRTLGDLEAELTGLLEPLGLTGQDRFETAVLHERVQCLLERGDFAQSREVAARLLRRHPDFVPALNNLGEAHFREAQIDQAVATARRALEGNPENCHALSNLTRYCYLSGRFEEAERWAERLKAAPPHGPDAWIKKAEALSYLGDDQGVLDAFGAAQKAWGRRPRPKDALLHHLAAVAAMRLGKERKARNCWKQALKLAPACELAQENLEELKRPVGQRHAPWSYSLSDWIPQRVVGELVRYLGPRARHRTDGALTRQTRKFLDQHPHVVALVPALLDRGDPAGREFAARVAMLAETPELLAALEDFALGQRGPDKLRMKAAQFLCQADVLPAGPIRLWREGRWQETGLFAFQLHDEPLGGHSPQVEALASDAMEALRRDDGEEAERLLRQALELEPDAPDLLNNLSAAYQAQKRWDEAEHLIRQIRDRFPDYLFGRVNTAHLHVRAGQLDAARQLLEPLLERKRFHLSEFGALCGAYIDLFLTEGNFDGVDSWLELWEQADPDSPHLAAWRRRLSRRGLRRLLGRTPA